MSRQKNLLVLVLICGLVSASLLVGRLVAAQPFVSIATFLTLVFGAGVAVSTYNRYFGEGKE